VKKNSFIYKAILEKVFGKKKKLKTAHEAIVSCAKSTLYIKA